MLHSEDDPEIPVECPNLGVNVMCWNCWGVKEVLCGCDPAYIKFCTCEDNSTE